METLRQTLLDAVRAGAAQMQYYFDKKHDIVNKDGANNPVTEADKASEKAILAEIKTNFPDHDILSEESGSLVQNSRYKWIIDPIDGTVNYAQGIPICCVSIGVELDGQMILGAVLNPFLNELFFAEKGQGATLNGHPIHVSAQNNLDRSCIATGFPYQYINDENGPLPVFGRFISKGIAVRRLGSAALDLCYTACGRFDAYYEHTLNAWDASAGFLMVEEAGGKVTDLQGDEYSLYQPGIVASNGLIHDKVLNAIADQD